MIQHSNDNTVKFTAVQKYTERCRKIHYSLQQYKLYGTVYNNIVLFTAIKNYTELTNNPEHFTVV